MKRILAVILCVFLLLGCVSVFASCNKSGNGDDTTTADNASENTTDAQSTKNDDTSKPDVDVTTVETDAATTAANTEAITSGDETTAQPDNTEPEATTAQGTDTTPDDVTTTPDATDTDEPPVTEPVYGKDDVVISSAEDLIKFHDSIYKDEKEYCEMTVYLTADINLEGYEWIPLDGYYLDTVTFNGQGHTIKNFTIVDTEDFDPYITSAHSYGFGFIGNSCYDLTFKNLNFDTVNITAYERHCGTLIGEMSGGYVSVENVDISNVTLNGYMMNGDDSGHKISFRNSGYIGVVFAGDISFTDCNLDNAYITGFHNLSAFVGYDGANVVNEYCFTNCTASNMTLEFSYCQSATYSPDKSYKFVSVFYNGVLWADNTANLFAEGETNSYNNVKYIDHMTGQEYSPENFISWTEDHPSYIKYVENGASSFKDID